MRKRYLSLLLCVLMMTALLPALNTTAEALSQQDAVNWLYAQEGRTNCDIDGNGKWCPDLATAYMNYCWLRTNNDYSDPWRLYPYTTYNGNQYDNVFASNPNWTVFARTSTTVPQPGDLFVSEYDSLGFGYGHVGIVLEASGSTGAKVIEMSGGVNPTISNISWGSQASYGAEHFIRFNYFTPSTRTLDVNGYLDGADSHYIGDYGTFDVYINGSKAADDVNDYYASHPAGTSYKITDIKPKDGKAYQGYASGSDTITGTLDANRNVRLWFFTPDAHGWTNNNKPAAISVYNGHTYHYYSTAVTWWGAKKVAEYLGGHLVTISSAGENSFIYNLGGNNTLWLGATDRDREGTWKWVNGESFSYSNWGSGEPNNSAGSLSGTQNYAVMWAREGEEGTWDDEDGSTPYPFVVEFDKPEKSVLSFSKNNVTTDAIKLLRWQGMDAASTGEPRNRGYDPTQTSDTVEIRLNGAPMAYSTANLAKAKELLRGVKYESLTHSGAVSQRVTESGGGLRVADKLSISFGSSGGNITATVTALKPVAMRLTMADGSECLIATPGDVNLDGSMDANDWTTIMRWTLQASSRYDVTDYPGFTLNGQSFDLWALLADMTGTGVSGNRSNRVDANDWTTIMYLTLQAWKK